MTTTVMIMRRVTRLLRGNGLASDVMDFWSQVLTPRRGGISPKAIQNLDTSEELLLMLRALQSGLN